MTTLTGTYCPGGGQPFSASKRSIVRCKGCNRRLLLAEVYDEDQVLVGFNVPAHKPKAKATKKTLRKPRGSVR